MNTYLSHFSRVGLALLACAVSGELPAAPAAPAELTEAVTRWAGERDRWAFTQAVKEFDGEEVKQERLETYDPSRPFDKRWELLNIDGRAPTESERATWDKRKNKKSRRDNKPLVDYFDFERAKLIDGNAKTARYDLPLKGGANWLFSTDKVQLTITVNKETHSVERVDARISEPFKVALGLARILNFDLELHMQPVGEGTMAEPGTTAPSGTVSAVVNKLGQRVEYRWNEFKRVTPHADWAKFTASS